MKLRTPIILVTSITTMRKIVQNTSLFINKWAVRLQFSFIIHQ